MSDACNGIGCKEKGPHLNFQTLAQERLADLDEDQRQEGRRREIDLSDLAPISDGSDAPFTTDGTLDESPRPLWETAIYPFEDPEGSALAWYRDMAVEVVDPTGMERLIDRIDNPTFEDTVDAVLGEARDLIVDRQRTYGASNIEQQGILGVVNRITFDKAARIRKRLNGKIVNGEIVLDEIPMGTVDEPGIVNDAFDFIGYAVCLILLLRGEWGAPLDGDGPSEA